MSIKPIVTAAESHRHITDQFPSLGIGHGWLFRGQCRSAWGISPSLERLVLDPSERLFAERFAFDSFGRTLNLHGDVSQFPKLQPWSFNTQSLFFMLHHGVPTRLVDFTESVYVATYFALEMCERGQDSVAVWAVNARLCNQSADQMTANHYEIAGKPIPRFPSGKLKLPLDEPTFPSLVHFYRSEYGYARVVAQQGWAGISTRLDAPFEEGLATCLPETEAAIVRFDLSTQNRKGLLEDLYSMNLHREMLFPGLQGLGDKIRISIESRVYK